MKHDYEVGYRKPPKATRFGNRPQPATRSRSAKQVDVAAAIDRPMTMTRNGVSVRVHPHEALMLGLAKAALGGKLRAIKEFFVECKKAGLLDAPPAEQTSGVLVMPKGVPLELGILLLKTAGLPPWDNARYDQCKAEYQRDCENIERLTAAEKARRNEKIS